ncbi:ABC-three component system middle component 4 [Paraburkholderia sp. SIMBA_049]
MTEFEIIDFRDEYHVQMFRRWLVVSTLCKNKKFENGVALEKAAFVDFLLCNPRVMQRLLVNFGRTELTLNLEDLLYRDNIELGSAHDEKSFATTCVLLIERKYMSFFKREGMVYLHAASRELTVENELVKRWNSEINALQPLLGRSANVLQNSVIGGVEWN